MKRFLTFLAVAASAVLAATSCQDNTTPDVAGPSISWSSNPDFDTVTIDDELDANLTVTAPAGIKSLVAVVESDSELFMGTLESIFGTSSLDFINDAKVIKALAAVAPDLPAGDALKDQKEVNFNITDLVKLISRFAGTEEENHKFTVNVTDNNGKSTSVTCIFRTVPAAEEDPDDEVTETAIAWPGNEDFAPVEISSDMNATLKVTAVGGIKSFVVKAPESLSTILGLAGLSVEMDLINNEKVIAALAKIAPDMPTGENLKGKTSLDLNISSLLNTMGVMLLAGEYEFVLTVTDSNDEEVSAICTFIKA